MIRSKLGIGVARYTEEADNEDELVRRADGPMYAAKLAEKNAYRIATVPAVTAGQD